jgi:hypothetical protein
MPESAGLIVSGSKPQAAAALLSEPIDSTTKRYCFSVKKRRKRRTDLDEINWLLLTKP